MCARASCRQKISFITINKFVRIIRNLFILIKVSSQNIVNEKNLCREKFTS